MPASLYLRYLLLPAHGTVLVFIAVISLGLTGARYAGLFGYPLAVIMLSWLCNYAYILLEAVANGAREPPVLAIEMLNPLHEARPLFQFILLLIVAVALSLLALYVDLALASALALLALIAWPASTGALAIGTDVWQSVHPAVLWHIARALGRTYLAILAIVLSIALAWWQVLRFDLLPQWLLIPISVFAWLSCFALIGGSLFEHRHVLGHDAIDAPERRQARVQHQIDRERERFLAQIHGQARSGNLAGAWHTIEAELALQNHTFEYYDWLLERLSERDDARLAYRLAQEYVARALGRDNARATRVAQRALKADPEFRPRSAAQCLRVAELLRLSGDKQNAQSLLRDFARHYPSDAGLNPDINPDR